MTPQGKDSGQRLPADGAHRVDSVSGHAPLRVLILSHYYPPEVGGPQTKLAETASFLKQQGHALRVVTSLPSYPTGIVPPAYRGRLGLAEAIEGISVYRTWVYARPGSSAPLRLANQLSFTITALAAMPFVGRQDVLLVQSPPLFLAVTGAVFGLILRAPVVLQVDDPWPAVAIDLGAIRNPALVRAAESFERWVYRACRKLVVVTEQWRQELVRRGVEASKVSLVSNGVDTDVLDPLVAREEGCRVRTAMSLDGKVVVACIGTIGYVYDYDIILRAANALKARDNLHFLIVGDGSQASAVRQQAAALRLANITLVRGQPYERVPSLLAAADISVVGLQPLPVTRGTLPIRVLEAMAMSLPVVVAGAGEAPKVVEESGAGIAVKPRAFDKFVEALLKLSADEDLRREMGARGRRTIVARFSRSAVAERLESVLYEAAAVP